LFAPGGRHRAARTEDYERGIAAFFEKEPAPLVGW
jgi:hypothetical protein